MNFFINVGILPIHKAKMEYSCGSPRRSPSIKEDRLSPINIYWSLTRILSTLRSKFNYHIGAASSLRVEHLTLVMASKRLLSFGRMYQ